MENLTHQFLNYQVSFCFTFDANWDWFIIDDIGYLVVCKSTFAEPIFIWLKHFLALFTSEI